MPYKKIKDLPKRVKNNLPMKALKIFRKVFNNSYKKYHDDERAFKTAWSVVKKKYEKKKGKWTKKA